jgi:hypothetical protein
LHSKICPHGRCQRAPVHLPIERGLENLV